jgi:hypothetical protein
MSRELPFKVGDRVRTIEDLRNRGLRYDGKVLELDAVNWTALIKGAPSPIRINDLELVELLNPSAGPSERERALRRLGL